LITNIFRAWRFNKNETSWKPAKPILLAPAMNTDMYEHPITDKQINYLKNDLGVIVLDTVEKTLVCG